MKTDTISCGPCEELIPQLDNTSIALGVTSPPYADQRKSLYNSISEKDYPDWFAGIMQALRPKLTTDGSILVIIRPHIKNGQISDYVLRTRLAIRAVGYYECEELIWYKPDGPPLGSLYRPRRAWESILWYSKTPRPFADFRACGRLSDHIGFVSKDRHGLYHGTSGHTSGRARITDVFTAMVSSIAPGITHPAMFPQTLAEQLIRTFSRPGDIVLDPFMGSGTTGLAALASGRRYVGFDLSQKYVELAAKRLADFAGEQSSAALVIGGRS